VSRHPDRYPRAVAVAMRVMFGLGVFMAVWTCSTYLLWQLGIPLRIGAIERGLMAETWWTGPACIAWSLWIYWELRPNRSVGAPR